MRSSRLVRRNANSSSLTGRLFSLKSSSEMFLELTESTIRFATPIMQEYLTVVLIITALTDTLRILPASPEDSQEPGLGIERGGLESAESLWARYFMYTQLYFHPTRRIYDMHLMEFLKGWLPGGRFPTDVDKHISISDNEVTAGMCGRRQPIQLKADPFSKNALFRENTFAWSRSLVRRISGLLLSPRKMYMTPL